MSDLNKSPFTSDPEKQKAWARKRWFEEHSQRRHDLQQMIRVVERKHQVPHTESTFDRDIERFCERFQCK